MLGVSAAFGWLEKALDNTTRPAQGLARRIDRPTYRLSSITGYPIRARLAAAELIEECRRRSMVGGPKTDPDRPIAEWTDGKFMMAASIPRYGQHGVKPEGR
jgi:hypothetical protein